MGVFKCTSDDSDESYSGAEETAPRAQRSAPFVIRRMNRPGFGPIDRPRATPIKTVFSKQLPKKAHSPSSGERPHRGYAVAEYDSEVSDESDTSARTERASVSPYDPFVSASRVSSKSDPATPLSAAFRRRTPRELAVSGLSAKDVTLLKPLERLMITLSVPKSEELRRSLGSEMNVSKSQLLDSTPANSSISRSPRAQESESAKRNAAAVKATLALRITTRGPHPAKIEARRRQHQKEIEGRYRELQRITDEADQHASDHVKQIRKRDEQMDDEALQRFQKLQIEGEREIARQVIEFQARDQGMKKRHAEALARYREEEERQIARQKDEFEARDQAMKKRHADAMARYRQEEARKTAEPAERLAKQQAETEARERAEKEAEAREAAERAAEVQRKKDSEERATKDVAERKRVQEAEKELVSTAAREEAEPYVQLMKHLKEDVIPNEKLDLPTREFCVQSRRDLIKRICQITDKHESINLATREVDRVLKEGKERSDLAYEFVMYHAAKTAIGCAERNGMKDIPPIARMCLNVMKAHKDFTKYFLARLIKKCPYGVPRYGGQENGAERTRKAKGYKDGETFDSFLSRMRSMLQLYAAITTLEPLATPGSHPRGIEHAWRWLARFCNMRPHEYFAGSLVDAFLSVAATPLLNRYGMQFLKLLAFLRTDYVEELLRLHDIRSSRPYADFILTNVMRFEEQGVYPADKEA